MTEKEYKEYIEECDKWIDDFNKIAKRLGVEPTGGDVPINMAFILKLLRAIEKVLDSQPCDDAVSRQAIYDELEKWEWQELYLPIHFKENIVDVIPPVTPTRPKGKWIMTNNYLTTAYGSVDYVKCSCCGKDSLEEGDYCPNCGADMKEGEA